jgi:hypothetical protein
MEIGKQPSDQLLSFCGMTIKRCLFEMSQNKADEDIVIMANILMTDLNDQFHRLTQQDVTQAFHRGVRTGEQLAINPRTWCNWLNSQKLKSNATRINAAQIDEKMRIETKFSSVDKNKVLREFLELCVIEPYEEYCNDEEISLQGVNQIYIWLEKNSFLLVPEEEKEKIWREVQGMIKRGKMFLRNNAKKYHPVIMCREIAIINLFEQMREAKTDLRKEIFKVLEDE